MIWVTLYLLKELEEGQKSQLHYNTSKLAQIQEISTSYTPTNFYTITDYKEGMAAQLSIN